MPTGYTAAVATGEMTDFNTFVWNCARAFVPLVTLRDEPLTGTRPEPFKPSSFYEENMQRIDADLTHFLSMTSSEAEAARDAAQQELEASVANREAERQVQAANYQAMIDKVNSWLAPTDDHLELKKFMLTQLQESLKFDCGGEYTVRALPPAEEWWAQRITQLTEDLGYYTKEFEKEQTRVARRNQWVEQLAESLK